MAKNSNNKTVILDSKLLEELAEETSSAGVKAPSMKDSMGNQDMPIIPPPPCVSRPSPGMGPELRKIFGYLAACIACAMILGPIILYTSHRKHLSLGSSVQEDVLTTSDAASLSPHEIKPLEIEPDALPIAPSEQPQEARPSGVSSSSPRPLTSASVVAGTLPTARPEVTRPPSAGPETQPQPTRQDAPSGPSPAPKHDPNVQRGRTVEPVVNLGQQAVTAGVTVGNELLHLLASPIVP